MIERAQKMSRFGKDLIVAMNEAAATLGKAAIKMVSGEQALTELGRWWG